MHLYFFDLIPIHHRVSGPGVGAKRVHLLAPRLKAPMWSGTSVQQLRMVHGFEKSEELSQHANTEGANVSSQTS